MKHRTIKSVTGASPQPGTGILRPFPSAKLANIDPFVFLDTGVPRQLGSRDIYVGPHPHRGVQPVSLLFRGRIEHRDSLGNERVVESGGMQWLVSGSGALHEEVLQGDASGVFHMAQLWINVPGALKMAPAEHHAVPAEDIPEISTLGPGSKVRLYAGALAGITGPAPMPTKVLVAYVILEAGGRAVVPIPADYSAAFTVVAGSVTASDNRSLQPGDTPVFHNDGASVAVSSAEGGSLLLMCGRPIGEPIATGGGFVMNTPAEVQAAFADYRNGKMGRLQASR